MRGWLFNVGSSVYGVCWKNRGWLSRAAICGALGLVAVVLACQVCADSGLVPLVGGAAGLWEAWWTNRGWLSRTAICGGLGLLAAVLACRIWANSGLSPVVRSDLDRGNADGEGGAAGKKTLVVLVHGYGEKKMREDVRAAVREQRPGDDILMVHYPAHLFSNADPIAIARNLSNEIEKAADEKGNAYQNIILVGYSLGALLVRKAYLHGSGWREDDPVARPIAPANWVGRVDRIVLLAGMNRGWSIDHPPAHMAWGTKAKWWLGREIGRMTSTVGLARSCESGSPFVADLRVQWMRHIGRLKRENKRVPPVIQLLGTIDDTVNAEDSRDVSVSRDFIWIVVENTGHTSLVDFSDPNQGKYRKEQFLLAMDPDPGRIEAIRKKTEEPPFPQDLTVKRVVFVLHGIRDMGHWATEFQAPLEAAYKRAHAGAGDTIRVEPVSYGYFGMGPFLLHGDRHRYVRWFMDQYTEALAKYPNADGQIDFVGHSNGTYVLARSLQDYRTLRVNHVVFAGSVVRRDYDWDAPLRRGQVKRVENYLASSDWVVALFPHFFELPLISTVFSVNDIGGAGFHGFLKRGGEVREVGYVEGAHGAALDSRNIPSIVGFLMDDPRPPDLAPKANGQSGLLLAFSNVCWLVWIVFVAAIVTLGYFIALFGAGWTPVPAVWWVIFYMVIVWGLLYTV
jgi:predicted esterase